VEFNDAVNEGKLGVSEGEDVTIGVVSGADAVAFTELSTTVTCTSAGADTGGGGGGGIGSVGTGSLGIGCVGGGG